MALWLAAVVLATLALAACGDDDDDGGIEPIHSGRILLDRREITDEGTDPELVGEVLTVIRELAKSGMTMMIATHEMGFARQIADKVCFVYEGVILKQGPPETIFGSPKEQRTQGFLRRIVEAGRAADLEANA